MPTAVTAEQAALSAGSERCSFVSLGTRLFVLYFQHGRCQAAAGAGTRSPEGVLLPRSLRARRVAQDRRTPPPKQPPHRSGRAGPAWWPSVWLLPPSREPFQGPDPQALPSRCAAGWSCRAGGERGGKGGGWEQAGGGRGAALSLLRAEDGGQQQLLRRLPHAAVSAAGFCHKLLGRRTELVTASSPQHHADESTPLVPPRAAPPSPSFP